MTLQGHPINKSKKFGDVIQLNQAVGIIKMIFSSNIANFNKPFPLFLQKELGYN